MLLSIADNLGDVTSWNRSITKLSNSSDHLITTANSTFPRCVSSLFKYCDLCDICEWLAGPDAQKVQDEAMSQRLHARTRDALALILQLATGPEPEAPPAWRWPLLLKTQTLLSRSLRSLLTPDETLALMRALEAVTSLTSALTASPSGSSPSSSLLPSQPDPQLIIPTSQEILKLRLIYTKQMSKAQAHFVQQSSSSQRTRTHNFPTQTSINNISMRF